MKSKMIYKRTQVGTGILIFFSVIIALAFGATGIGLDIDKANSVPLISINSAVLLVVIASAVIFSKMTIAVGNGKVSWQLGYGLVRREIDASEIRSCKTIQTSGLTLGLRKGGNGTLWIVSGRDAVALYLKSGKIVALGTPDKERLCREISALIAQTKA